MMDSEIDETLVGGMMNAPRRVGHCVFRKRTSSTETIHQLLRYVRERGIHWVPEPISMDQEHEQITYIEGDVPHTMPPWIWKEHVLIEIATFIREWHDASIGFDFEHSLWNFDTQTESEVICHNDFAPYNCVFSNEKFVGLIDFDLCAPGARLWDLAYTAYRYIPIMPEKGSIDDEYSPFNSMEMHQRIDVFLDAYSKGHEKMRYGKHSLFLMTIQRLKKLSQWTRKYAKDTKNDILARNAEMYENHANWIRNELI